MKTYWISLSYATFILEVDEEKVVYAAPIAKWATGKKLEMVLDYWKKKGQLLEWRIL